MTRATGLPDWEYVLSMYRSENCTLGLSIVWLPMVNVRNGAVHDSRRLSPSRPASTRRTTPGVSDVMPALAACSRVITDDGAPESRIAWIGRSLIFTVN